MKTQSRSLNLLKLLLAIGWWVTILGAALVLVFGTLAVINPGEFLDVKLTGIAGSVDSSSLSAVTRDGLLTKVEFHEPVRLKIEVPVEHWESRRVIVALGGIVFLAQLALALFFLRFLRQIVWSVEEGDPFVSQNAKRLRMMGVIMIASAFVGALLKFAVSGYADAVLRPTGFNLDGHFGLDFNTIILGLSVIALSEVFRIGTQMREEQQLTI